MPCIVIDNPAWDRENPTGWGGPEYLEFDAYNPDAVETTRQWLTLWKPNRWFRYTVEVERENENLHVNYKADTNRAELGRHSRDESQFVWEEHVLHGVRPGRRRGPSTWIGARGPGWKVLEPDQGRRDRKPTTIWAIQRGQGSFRNQLLELDGRCAISGETCHEALEAAHIVPAHKGGRENIINGILLRADLHRMYDSEPPKFEICSETGKVSLSEGFNYQSLHLNRCEIDEPIRRRIREALCLRNKGEC